ncbi:hypothetical protein, partial [Klebsiella variicola]|uniref:hypothetical protein n=1 Tax=Klebsiella variicola TaxID=244366 RepID=UPI00272F6CDC
WVAFRKNGWRWVYRLLTGYNTSKQGKAILSCQTIEDHHFAQLILNRQQIVELSHPLRISATQS